MPPNIFSEALHGMCSGCGRRVDFGAYTSSGCPTAFPQVISMGATWNRSLWSAVGEAVGNETRGLYSQGAAIGWESALFIWYAHRAASNVPANGTMGGLAPAPTPSRAQPIATLFLAAGCSRGPFLAGRRTSTPSETRAGGGGKRS